MSDAKRADGSDDAPPQEPPSKRAAPAADAEEGQIAPASGADAEDSGGKSGTSPAAAAVTAVTAEAESTAAPTAPMAAAVPPGEAPPGAVTMRVLLEAKDAGHIIGKKGAIISQLRETSKCTISISSNEQKSQTERVLTVIGQPSEVFTAFFSICANLQNEAAAAAGAAPSGAAPPLLTLRLLIHKSQAGAIIGKQGSTIKQIKENCGVNLRMNDTCLPFSSERECHIVGDSAAVAQAVNYIAAILQQTPMRGAANFYRPELVAGGVAAGGSVWQQQPPPTMAVGAYDPTLASMLAAGQQQHHAPPASAAGQHQIQLQIPSEMAGALIGPRGTKISEIRQLSHANVRVGDRLPGVSSRTVTISGSPDACRLAVTLINQRITEHQLQQQQQPPAATGYAGYAPSAFAPPSQ